MADATVPDADGEAPGPVIRDRRRLDPETGKVRQAYAAAEPTDGLDPLTGRDSVSGAGVDTVAGEVAEGSVVGDGSTVAAAQPEPDSGQALADERLADLQRLQAEYVNYRRRVERDREVARDSAVASVLEALLPVLDDVQLARQHGDLEGTPFAPIADKLDAVLGRFGLERYGRPGEEFDPTVHEALLHTQAELAEGTSTTTVVQILQPGYRAKDRVLRAARVAVADPA